MPAYHYWLNCPASVRIEQLNRWLEDLRIIEEGVAMTLKLVRESATPVEAIASGGFYHRTLEPSGACSLVRIAIPREQGLFPEISAGKHRFTLRFMEQPNTGERPVQTTRDVKFELHLCALTP
jgi:cell division protein ZapD